MGGQQLTDLTFDDLRALLEEDGQGGLLDALDAFAGASLVVGAALGGGPGLLALLGPKNELVKIGKQLLAKIAGDSEDFRDRHRRMALAHQLVVYTSFFEAAEPILAVARKEISLSDDVVRRELASPRPSGHGHPESSHPGDGAAPIDEALLIPHPVQTLEDRQDAVSTFYASLARGLSQALTALPGWLEMSLKVQDDLGDRMQMLPYAALEAYEARYFELAARFPQFLTWANMHQRLQEQEQLDEISQAIARVEALQSDGGGGKLDVGLAELGLAVASIPAAQRAEEARLVSEGLARTYADAISERIIEDSYDEAGVTLVYPRRKDIFIPQAFRALTIPRRAASAPTLEKESLWRESGAAREGLGAFLLNYLGSPYSTETPLVVLGHPGSGKSLLTWMLAARLATPNYNPVRIELRDIDVEQDLQAQIESQIATDTGRRIDWATFSDRLADAPPVLILDGFDELLQASGRVYADYLAKVQRFQQREAVQGRPLRAIVTSRITLIDKAQVPAGTTVLRLEEFDARRRRKWIDVWNAHNEPYFAKAGVNRFELPDEEAVEELASQPLLLLMLALFDSEDNQLHEHVDLDRTLLYDNLLRRFVVRERSKGEDGSAFQALDRRRRQEEVDREMRRLGVAAMSMFNRRTLHILSDQLDHDISYFGLERPSGRDFGVPLSQGDLLLGSFFFVHESRSPSGARRGEADDDGEVDSAFEFLHNTFGEFLTADFILSTVIEQARTLSLLTETPGLETAFEQQLQPDNLSDSWFLSLGYTPLFTRPVVLEMIGEWTPHALERARLEEASFVASMEALLYAQLRHLLAGSAPPAAIGAGAKTPYEQLSLLDHYGIYSLNLILLRVAVAADGQYRFDETALGPREEGATSAWDRLVHLWRLAMPRASLAGLAADMRTTRWDGQPEIAYEPSPDGPPPGVLGEIWLAAEALGDDATSAIAGLLLDESISASYGTMRIGDIAEKLDAAGIDLELWLLLRDLRRRGWVVDPRRDERLCHHLTSREPFTRLHAELFGLLAHPDAPPQVLDAVRSRLPVPSLDVLLEHSAVYGEGYVKLAAALDSGWARELISRTFRPDLFEWRQIQATAALDPSLLAAVVDLMSDIGRIDDGLLPRSAGRGGPIEVEGPEIAGELAKLAREARDGSLLIALLRLGLEASHDRLYETARNRLRGLGPAPIVRTASPDRLRMLVRAYDKRHDPQLRALLAAIAEANAASPVLPIDIAFDLWGTTGVESLQGTGRDLLERVSWPGAATDEEAEARLRLTIYSQDRDNLLSQYSRAEQLMLGLGLTDRTRLTLSTWRALSEWLDLSDIR